MANTELSTDSEAYLVANAGVELAFLKFTYGAELLKTPFPLFIPLEHQVEDRVNGLAALEEASDMVLEITAKYPEII